MHTVVAQRLVSQLWSMNWEISRIKVCSMRWASFGDQLKHDHLSLIWCFTMGKRRGLCILVDINKPAQINDCFSVLFVFTFYLLYFFWVNRGLLWIFAVLSGLESGVLYENTRILKSFGFFLLKKFFVYNNWIAQIAIVIRRKSSREIFHGLCYTEGQAKLSNYFCYHKLKFITASEKSKFKSEDRQMRLMRELRILTKSISSREAAS